MEKLRKLSSITDDECVEVAKLGYEYYIGSKPILKIEEHPFGGMKRIWFDVYPKPKVGACMIIHYCTDLSIEVWYNGDRSQLYNQFKITRYLLDQGFDLFN